jgi:hypothetical protein
MVARQATEQIMDLRYTLRMLGIPLDGPAWMFGDNQSVITSSTIPHSNLNKRHNALSYHRVREAISAGILYFLHIDGKLNPSDILTKFLPWVKFWPLIQPLLFWKGETMKDIHPSLPITQVIEAIALAASTGLRGVSDNHGISPQDAFARSIVAAIITRPSSLKKDGKILREVPSKTTPTRVRFKDISTAEAKVTNHCTAGYLPSRNPTAASEIQRDPQASTANQKGIFSEAHSYSKVYTEYVPAKVKYQIGVKSYSQDSKSILEVTKH